MVYVLLGFLGLALGSFINALVWRMHIKTTVKSSKHTKELSIVNGRSMCIHCKHTLAWFDLIPVLSWLTLRGKCRYCKKPISVQYPLVELLAGVLFLLSYLAWPYALGSVASYVTLALWLVLVSIGLALTIYDLKWMILPNRLVYPFGFISVLFAVLLAVSNSDYQILISSAIGSVLYGGFFYAMYQISDGKWIGGGDVRIGFVLGIILGWPRSILSLTLAAYLGSFVILILFILGKYHKKMKLPFGPFLLASLFIAMLWGQSVIDWYLRLSGV